MKTFELLQDYKSPEVTIPKGTRKTSEQWFWQVFHQNYDGKNAQSSTPVEETWCKEHSSWFAEIKSHPSKEEIIEETAKESYSMSNPFPIVLTKKEVLSCMDKFESSLKEQLLEKIEKIKIDVNNIHGENERGKIISLIRNFKSE